MTQFPSPKLQYKLAIVSLQENRQFKIALWRASFLIGCLASLGCLLNSSLWKIKNIDQIQINGNKLVASTTIYQALDLTYPQLIWKMKVVDLTQRVESIPAVAIANMNRQILPPRLIISLQERTPSAIAISNGKIGFLDVEGKWIAQEFYTGIENNFTLPKLVVHNYQTRYQKSWINLHRLISLHPELTITQVEWNQSGNLFLQTKIGKVSLGTNSSRFKQQFEIMLKLQNLSDRVENNQIDYIDLSNPDINLIQKY